MVDKIIGNKGFAPLGNISRTGHAGAAKNTGSTQKSDRVDFSSALQNATKAQEVSETRETSRSEQLQALKAQIEDGTYKPDLDKVAASLMPFMLKDS